MDTRDGLIFRSQLDSSLRRWPLTMTQARPRVSVFEKSGLTPGPSVAAAMPPSLLGPSLQVAEFWAWGCRAVLPLGLPPCGLPQVLSREPQFVGCKHRMSRDPEVLGAGSRRDRVAPCRELSPVCRGPVSQVLGTAGFCQQSPVPLLPWAPIVVIETLRASPPGDCGKNLGCTRHWQRCDTRVPCFLAAHASFLEPSLEGEGLRSAPGWTSAVVEGALVPVQVENYPQTWTS